MYNEDDAGAAMRQLFLEEQQQQEQFSMFKARQRGGGDFKPIDVGVHRGVASLLVDLGMQAGGQYDPAYKVALGFQLTDQLSEKGEPLMITQTYTNSMNKKANLRKLIESWFGKAFPSEEAAENFDLSQLLGRPALVNVVHTQRADKTYANIATVMSLPAGTEKPALVGQTLLYTSDLPQSERSAAYARLPEWLRKKVDAQLVPSSDSTEPTTDAEEDVPF